MTVSCIVPAWNEGARIGAVLDVLCAHPLVDEVVVVDDCSTDDTAAVAAARPRVTLIRQPRNGGKTRALAAGIAAARGDVLLLIDADLTGLDAGALTALLRPVLGGHADIAISLRRNAPRLWHLIGLDYISGERALRRTLLPPLGALGALPRFGFEVWLNDALVAAGARIAVVRWPRVDSPAKSAKRGGRMRGLAADVAMIVDMCRTVSPARLARQIAAMRRLRV